MKLFNLMTLLALASLQAPSFAGDQVDDLSALEREELEAELVRARTQMDAAAQKLSTVHGRLYATETSGQTGQLGMLMGERGPNGALRHEAVRIGGPGSGLRLVSMDGDLAEYFGVESGVLVLSVPPVGEGETATLRAGDVLLGVDGVPVLSPGDGYRALMAPEDAADGGETVVAVELMRHGSRDIVSVTPKQFGAGFHSISIRSGGLEELDVQVTGPDFP